MKYTFIIFFILLIRFIFRLFRFRFFWIGSRGFTFLIIRSMMLIRLKMCMTWMIWFSPFSVISIYRTLVFKKSLKALKSFVLLLLFTYLFTLLHSTFTESRLSISAANRWFRSDARAGVAITSFWSKIRTELGRIKILPVLKDDFSWILWIYHEGSFLMLTAQLFYLHNKEP